MFIGFTPEAGKKLKKTISEEVKTFKLVITKNLNLKCMQSKGSRERNQFLQQKKIKVKEGKVGSHLLNE